ncbi:MAG: Nif3-like dinuclear metal center hexameric protein [Actinomycetota bacterium]|nr:Nif3-like dinuclear metal center hexameric protein [Actinomycetota bacterium]
MAVATLADVVTLLDRWYPPQNAEPWDVVGLVCGEPRAEVRRILLAVDPAAAVAAEAITGEADLLVAHHPLFFKPVSSVAAGSPKGRVVHQLISNGCALFTAHTNADVPVDGVSQALALALGLTGLRPLVAQRADPRDKIVVFAPAEAAESIRGALADAGAGELGNYDSGSFSAPGEGRFRPLTGAQPTIGSVGSLETVDEVRIEVLCSRNLREAVLAAMLSIHPYEEPAYDVIELAELDHPDRGTGRVGTLAGPTTLRDFAETVARALPETAHGVRVSGDPGRRVETVALVGGAGDGWLDEARDSGADVYLTSDLRHHPASEFREYYGPALVDVAHWAAEWTWLPVLARKLERALGDTVEVRVSTTNTDPWTFRT